MNLPDSVELAAFAPARRVRRGFPPGLLRAVLVTVLAGLLASVPGVPAWADTPSNWWYDYYEVADVRAQGWTGAGVKIAVIDNQINPSLPVFQGAELTVRQPAICGGSVVASDVNPDSSHGSSVVALLIGNGQGPNAIRGISPRAQVSFYGYGNLTDCRIQPSGLGPFGLALRQAVSDGNRIVTTSVGYNSLPEGDVQELAKAEAAGVVILSATLDSFVDTIPYPFPANGVVSVGAFDQSRNLMKDHNDSSREMAFPEVTVVAAGVHIPILGSLKSSSWNDTPTGTGSSLSTPLVAGMLAVAWQKFPNVTGNQLIQSLIHNTGTKDHALQRDTTGGLGYGPASLRHLLSVDPAQYPDVNPLMDKSYGKPTAQDVAAASKGSGAASPTESQSIQATESSSGQGSNGLLVGLLVAVGAVGLVAVAGIVLLVAVIRRSGKRSGRVGEDAGVSVGVIPGVDEPNAFQSERGDGQGGAP